MRNHLLFLIFILLLTTTAVAADLTGIVSDAETGTPLSGAHILVDPRVMGGSQSSDEQGTFVLAGLEPGKKYTVSASYLGYRVAKVTVIADTSISPITLSLKPIILRSSDVVYTASRATEGETPASFTDLSGKQLREQYWAQDIPPLLSNLPGVYAYSEAGTGIGYTYLKIRGFDHKRVGVTINNIPLNDPEDGVVYWVDIPDLAANLQDVQLQRGVGFSNQSSEGFGGSLNLVTLTPGIDNPGITVNAGIGSFNTRKWSAAYNSGIVNNTYGFYGRFSKIQSEGYRDRSAADLWSYFLTGVRYGHNTRLTINVYGGVEVTQAAWDAAPESGLAANRRFNPITYDNTIDNFSQPHYELLHQWQPSEHWTVENNLFYIHGVGYYEQFKDGRDLFDFGYQPFTRDGSLVTETDLVNQKWVYKDHFGWTPRATWEHPNGTLQLGGDWQYYTGKHEGFVIWADNPPEGSDPRNRYYHYAGEVHKGGLFVQENHILTDKLRVIGDLEMRLQRYIFRQYAEGNFKGDQLNRFTVDYTFLNPKIGLNYSFTRELSSYLTAAMSHRAPVNDEYWDVWSGPDDLGVDPLFQTPDTVRSGSKVRYIKWSDPSIDPERVVNLEVGASWMKNDVNLKLDGYWMDFHNEIVPAGGIRDGSPVTDNAKRSLHRGIELEASCKPERGLIGWLYLTLSSDVLADYTVNEAVYDDDWNLVGVNAVTLDGNRIALFPSIMASVGVGYRIRDAQVTVDVQHLGKQYLDNTQSEDRTIDPSTVVGLSASLRLPRLIPYATLEANLRVNNLLNEEYETSGYVYGENYYYVGATRNVFLGLSALF
ncbi:MAG: TonB-dependent receptor [bacterium]